MQSRPPAFQFYANDWLSSRLITLLPPSHEGAYIRLLAYCWNDDHCSLPDDDEQLAVLSRLGAEWKGDSSAIGQLKGAFIAHPSVQGRLTNRRLYDEWKKLYAFHQERSESGAKGAKSRWKNKHSSARYSAKKELMAQGMANDSSSSSSSSSLLLTKKRPRTADDGFERIWRSYPRKDAKQRALKAFSKLKDPPLDLMLQAIEAQKASDAWQRDNGKFIPYCSTWLNEKRWEDEPTTIGTNGHHKLPPCACKQPTLKRYDRAQPPVPMCWNCYQKWLDRQETPV